MPHAKTSLQVPRLRDIAHAIPSYRALPAGRSVGVAHDLLDRVLEDLAALDRTLLRSGAEGDEARQRFSELSKTLARVGSRVLRLEEDVVQMRHFAYHDELTGLPNRSLLLDRLNQAVAQAARRQGRAAVLMVDLDGFKSVNDRFGHAIGDELLQHVGQRLLSSTRHADTISRYGGDEFVVLLPDVDGKDSATEVAQKIHLRLAEPFVISGRAIAMTACIGIAVYPGDGETPDALLERADSGMYQAKEHAGPDRDTAAKGATRRAGRRGLGPTPRRPVARPASQQT